MQPLKYFQKKPSKPLFITKQHSRNINANKFLTTIEEYQAIRKNLYCICEKEAKRADKAAELKISNRNFSQMVGLRFGCKYFKNVYFSVKIKYRRYLDGGFIYLQANLLQQAFLPRILRYTFRMDYKSAIF